MPGPISKMSSKPVPCGQKHSRTTSHSSVESVFPEPLLWLDSVSLSVLSPSTPTPEHGAVDGKCMDGDMVGVPGEQGAVPGPLERWPVQGGLGSWTVGGLHVRRPKIHRTWSFQRPIPLLARVPHFPSTPDYPHFPISVLFHLPSFKTCSKPHVCLSYLPGVVARVAVTKNHRLDHMDHRNLLPQF